MMELDDIVPSEISFHKQLFASNFSHIFLVTIRGQPCVMKHHGRGPRRYYEPEDREVDIHVLETTAYRRLQAKGVCDRGIVPRFLGSMRKFDPALCQPYLEKFLEDEYPPSALFLEYIPNMEMVDIHNFTPERADKLIYGIREIHKALVLHNDPRPRNMIVAPGTEGEEERVLWIDFDRAETYDQDTITDRQKYFLFEEEQIVIEFKEVMEMDCKKGEIEEAYLFFCT
ncbi:hypothetical protein BJX61DRAFT_258643 [Aspergillus egyptiacus]|nr:hypothetical protein BJX61DRAFT_258643 [Aspergillus egyptiacus]